MKDLSLLAEAADALVSDLAQELMLEVDELAAGVTDYVHGAAERVPSDAEFRSATHASALRIIPEILRRFSERGDMSTIEPPPVALAYAEEFVHRGIDLADLLAVVRLGYAAFADRWARGLQQHDAPGDVIAAAMARSLLDLFTYIDVISARLAVAYGAERERWARGLEATRVDITRAILDRQAIDRSSVEARLNHRLDGAQHAFLLWTDAEHAPGLRRALQVAGQDLVRRVGGAHVLLLPLGTKTVAGWIAPPLDGAQWHSVESWSEDRPVPYGIRAATGGVGDGVEGFRLSHEQAQLARRIAEMRCAPAGSVTRYEDIALVALATADLHQARAFVDYVLGPLAADDDATRSIARTLLVYLQEGRNRARTARRLKVHANTVAYRLQKARDLLGREPRERSAEFELALTIAPLIAPGVVDSSFRAG